MSSSNDPVQLAAELRLSVTRLARRLRQAADMGLSPSLLSALAIVHLHGPLTLGALAEIEGVSPPTVTKVVNRLQEDDLVERIVDPTDKRVCRVSTTAAGDTLLEASRERKTAWLSERLAALDAEQLATLAAAAVVLEQLSATEQLTAGSGKHVGAAMTRLRLATSETFASLQVRNFRLFFIGQAVSQIGTWLCMVAQTLLILELTGSGIALGLLAAAQFGPVLLLGAWAGVVADRSDKRRLLMIVQSLSMLQSFVLAALAFSGSPPVALIYAVAFAGGVLTAFDSPARRSFVVEMVPRDHINNAVSLNSAIMTGARVVGPALAGVLVATVGFGWTFLIDGVSYVAVLAGLLLMRPAELHSAPLVARAKGQVRAGLRYAASVPQLLVPLVMMAVIGTFAFNFQVVFPVFVIDDLGGTQSTFTLLFSVLSVGSLVGALAVARRTSSSVRRVGTTALAFGGAMAALAVAPNQAVAFAIGPLIGIASISFMTASTAIVQTESLAAMRGRVLALQSMVFLGSTPIGGPILGWVAEHLGARYAVGLGALACVAAGTWGLWMVRRRGLDRPGLSPGEVLDVTDDESDEVLPTVTAGTASA